jgi:hypothetical protein
MATLSGLDIVIPSWISWDGVRRVAPNLHV